MRDPHAEQKNPRLFTDAPGQMLKVQASIASVPMYRPQYSSSFAGITEKSENAHTTKILGIV
jgi:hypothetical protein